MHIIGGLVLIFAAWLAINYGPTAVSRAFNAETKLGLFESRIANIPAEFIRRSPRFAYTWEKFEDCMQRSACNPADILAERDRIIAQEWPALFDRLVVFSDWGGLRESRESRERFFETLKEKGADTLRNRCVPKIEYWRLPGHNAYSYYTLRGYECLSQQPDRKRPG